MGEAENQKKQNERERGRGEGEREVEPGSIYRSVSCVCKHKNELGRNPPPDVGATTCATVKLFLLFVEP